MTIQPLKIEDTTGTLNETLNAVKSKIGMLPNLYAVMAKAPAVLNNALTGSEHFKAESSLGAQIGEQIAIAIATANSCGYCLSAHTAIGNMVGVSEADLSAAQDGQASDPRAQAAVTLALELNRTHGKASDSAIEAAKSAGLSEQDILEVAGHVAHNILTNTVNNIAHTEIDFPKVELKQAA